MKPLSLLLILMLSFGTARAFASRVTCSARDKGWEEHWGGHDSCGSCQSKHGDCVETCSLEYSTCDAVGVDYLGNQITVKGAGDDRYNAAQVAVNLCQRNFANCRVVNCNSEAEQVSSRYCPKRPEPPAPAPKPPAPAPKPPGNGGPGKPGGPGGPGKPGPRNMNLETSALLQTEGN